MAQEGNSPEIIMAALEQKEPSVKNNAIWKSLKGKSPSEIESYVSTLAKTFNLVN